MIKSKFNSLFIGILGGLLVPVITFFCFYLIKINAWDSFSTYLRITFQFAILSKLISLAAIPDALLFYIFIWTENYRSAKGVIYSLFGICFIVIIIKIVH